MAISEKRAKDLAEIEPPRSVLRISNFLRDLTRSGMPTLDSFAIGGGGATMAMQTGILSRAAFFPGGGFLEAFSRLTAHYAVQAEDLEAFAHWLVVWMDKYREMEVIEDPRVYETPPPPPIRFVPAVMPPSLAEEPLRRTRRRDDPPREATERPKSERVEEPTRAEGPRETTPTNRQATFRPAKREPIPEPPEPPRRIDLATLVSRSRMVGAGSGMMLAGATLSPGQAFAGEMPMASGMPMAPPMGSPPMGMQTVVRTVYVDQTGTPIAPPSGASGGYAPPQAFSPRSVPTAPQAYRDANVSRPGPTFQAAEPARGGKPMLSEGSSYIESAPEAPGFESPQFEGAPGTLAKAPFSPQIGRARFPSVRTILTGAAVLVPALASAFQMPGRPGSKGEPFKGDGSVRPPGDGSVYPASPDGEAAQMGDGSVRPAYGDGSVRPGPTRGRGAFRTFATLAPLGAAAFAAAAPGQPGTEGPRGMWVPRREGGHEFVSQEMGFSRPHFGGQMPDGFQIRGAREDDPAGSPGRPSAGEPNGQIPNDPRYGQITLIAPPLKVASAEGERAGSAVQFEWSQLAENSGELDAAGLGRLAAMLPKGAQAIYPALPPGTANAANLRLGPGLLTTLLERGYGPAAAQQAAKIAAASSGPTKPARPVGASLVPIGRPAGSNTDGGVMGASKGGGAISDAGGAQSKRGGALDFLGVPVRLAPALGGRAELRNQQAVQSAGADMAAGRPIRPEAFAPLRQKLFPGLQSVAVEPDKAAWRKAAPSFGMSDGDPTTVLSSDATVKPGSASGPNPPTTKPGLASAIAGKLGANLGVGAEHPHLGAHHGLPSTPGHRHGAPTIGMHTPAFHGPRHPGFPATPGGSSAAFGGAPSASAFAGDGSVRPGGIGAGASFGSPTGGRSGVGGPAGFRPVSTPGPTGKGRTTATAAPSAVDGGQVPTVEQPPAPPSAPRFGSMPSLGSSASSPARPGGLGRGAGSIGAFSPPSTPALDMPSSGGGMSSRRPSPVRPTITVSAPAVPRRESSTPEMLYAAAPPRQAPRPLAIQRANSSDRHVSAASPSSSQNHSSDRSPEKHQASEASEVNSLATEVWSLLRRRLANEAERQGRY